MPERPYRDFNTRLRRVSALKVLMVALLVLLPGQSSQPGRADATAAVLASAVACPSPSLSAAPRVSPSVVSTPGKPGTTVTSAPTAPYPSWGISQGYNLLQLDQKQLAIMLDGIKATGIRVVRIDLPWGYIQRHGRGCFDFSSVLSTYDAARARGLTVLPVTSGVPDWVAVNDVLYGPTFQDFLYQAGLALIPRGITAVELMNEANLSGLSPAVYTSRVLIPGSTGLRAAAKSLGVTVSIVSSGPGPAKTGGGHWSQLDFVRGMYAAGGKGYFDVLGTHPYVWPADPSVPSDWNWMLKTAELRAVMEQNGDAAKPLWATEFGVPTNRGARGVDEQTQARYLRNGAAVWRSFPWAGLMVIYSYQDLAAADTDPEHHFGLMRVSGTPKPALEAVRSLVRS